MEDRPLLLTYNTVALWFNFVERKVTKRHRGISARDEP